MPHTAMMAGLKPARMVRGRLNAPLTGESGFTLIEALIASVILVVALAGFLSVAASTTNLDGRNVRLATANALIYDKYEALKLEPLDTWGCGVAPASTVLCPENNIGMDSSGAIVAGIYNRTVTVSQLADAAENCADSGGKNCAATSTTIAQQVLITVSWTGGSVSQTSVFMRTN